MTAALCVDCDQPANVLCHNDDRLRCDECAHHDADGRLVAGEVVKQTHHDGTISMWIDEQTRTMVIRDLGQPDRN